MAQPNPTAALEARIALLEAQLAKTMRRQESDQAWMMIISSMLLALRGDSFSPPPEQPGTVQ